MSRVRRLQSPAYGLLVRIRIKPLNSYGGNLFYSFQSSHRSFSIFVPAADIFSQSISTALYEIRGSQSPLYGHRVLQPAFIIPLRKICALMGAAALRRALPPATITSLKVSRLSVSMAASKSVLKRLLVVHHAGILEALLQACISAQRLLPTSSSRKTPHILRHRRFQIFGNFSNIPLPGFSIKPWMRSSFFSSRVAAEWVQLCAVLDKLGNALPARRPKTEPQQAVGAQPIGAMYADAGTFAGRVKPDHRLPSASGDHLAVDMAGCRPCCNGRWAGSGPARQ